MVQVKLFLLIFFMGGYCAKSISNSEPSNIHNAISEEERRGAPENVENNKNEGGKITRGLHSTSATHKHPQYYYPSGYDSHGSTGSGFSSGATHGYSSGTTGYTGYGGNRDQGYSGYDKGGFGSYISAGGNIGISGNHGISGGGHGSSVGSHGIGHGVTGHGQSYGGFGLGHQGGFNGALALKGLLIPLAGIALLGAAAALTTNPVLLQLGVVNGKRRRRSIDTSLNHQQFYPANPFVKPLNN
ncbi:PREDICTED: shematrin-like protein 2 [Nicrophorus vespilloides]|uniref:Shematrin-like protein 2 n=1 Tax=Nicrophorus vespilloides TaxID=110193 RepID=A0ABM1N8K6_NICVS|nr:PREDICTED: shematrin-like protein 2 [Nicrophorus vespilloides]